ncbi:cyclin-dependent kinase inhibitor 3 isoform X3 [Chiloscyllium plagiosum]|uniref:cyclin-dependent kinase inhibitor 3 isoform X3 n=1 Tax=Chiloscyllium plagiosum TaxID=36176 RepID=UPI001CB7CFCC|nr:cyclin-dependent kinase inhibitor 3 isoform X3 [Chiloscyllium plagiosum]
MVNLTGTMRTSEFDSSDEDSEEQNQLPLQVAWLALSVVNCHQFLGICALPEELKSHNIQDVFVLCTKGEMVKYRVPGLLESYEQQGFKVYHYPFPDGSVPDIANCWKILEELRICLENAKRILIQCYGGLGRSCLIAACLLLQLSDTMLPEEAIGHLRELRGAAAIQTVKQYNYLHDFRDNMATYLATKDDVAARSVSR